nr:hypothetical protein HK105_002654 [Polyrhizophydium stewartii]
MGTPTRTRSHSAASGTASGGRGQGSGGNQNQRSAVGAPPDADIVQPEHHVASASEIAMQATSIAPAADDPYGREHGAATSRSSLAHQESAQDDHDGRRSFAGLVQGGAAQPPASDGLPADFAKHLLKATQASAAATRQSTSHTLAEDEPGALEHNDNAMQDEPHEPAEMTRWLAVSVDPEAPSDCLRICQVSSISAVPKQAICRTVGDALRLGPGFVPTDIFVGAEIGAGCFGVVCEGLFQGQPVAIKRIVMHLHFDNLLLYEHEVQVYLHLRELWGTAVARLLSHGIDSHKSVSIITERGSHSKEWPDSDIRLAVASLEMIHNMGILHGDSHAGNVVFVGEGTNRRALWIDFEHSRFDDDQDLREAEIQRLRTCAISIRRNAEKKKARAERRLLKASLLGQ